MVVWSAQPGESFLDVENIGDVNGDGTDDIVAATTLNQSNGLYCFSGLTGDTLWVAQDLPGITLTGALCAIPDVNQDGFSDIALGTGWETGSSLGDVNVVSGVDGSSIWSRQTEWPIEAINYSTGPPDSYPILHATLWGISGDTQFLALDGQNADSLWCHVTWTDDRKVSVISDFSGNNWDEISICHDRGSAYSGLCEIVDGLTGTQLCSTGTIYFGAMDITDTPVFTIATRSWGGEIEILAANIISGDTLYTIPEGNLAADTLMFITGVSGGNLPFPILTTWSSFYNKVYLICGLSGSYQYSITYGSNVVLPFGYQVSENLWNLGVLTNEQFYITEPSITNPVPGPSCNLPSIPGRDFCFLNSDLYPTPLAAVVMSSGAGPGICTIATSWPVGIQKPENYPVIVNTSLLSNPCNGGIYLQTEEAQTNIRILDITGRLVESIQKLEAGIHFIPLPSGVYHIIERDDLTTTNKVVVLPN